jgi:hypothetical protein
VVTDFQEGVATRGGIAGEAGFAFCAGLDDDAPDTNAVGDEVGCFCFRRDDEIASVLVVGGVPELDGV